MCWTVDRWNENRLDEQMHSQVSKTEKAFIIAAAADVRSVSAFSRGLN
ncbi:MAG: hypothetical protein ACXVGB_14080 [Mycobacteriaceae bacterium]